MPISEKKCDRKECGRTFHGTKRAKYCSDYCRVKVHRERKRNEQRN